MNLRQQLAIDLGQKIPGCTVGTKFGHGSLEVDTKVFAFTRTDESAALKLPQNRIAELMKDGEICHLTMGKRTMREWAVVPNIAAPGNLDLLLEARTYVATLPKQQKRKPAKKAAKRVPKKAVKPR
jgi:hypothetical protein